jgi:phosphatidylinositol 3-kinase
LGRFLSPFFIVVPRLLARWKVIDPEDALLLLSPDFTVPAVREHAVDALRRATDDELLIYLLQLVQALRYEPLLLARAASGSPGGGVAAAAPSPTAGSAATSSAMSSARYRLSPLADFLIDRACASLDLANFLNWYLTVELEDARFGHVFSRIHSALFDALASTAAGKIIASKLAAQAAFLQQLAAAVQVSWLLLSLLYSVSLRHNCLHLPRRAERDFS